ncbi:hypothetical protein E3U43_002236 [Larimichthys crocea]|uniref:Uncharacterized protein n=1 Tax=Larimichthys crocea TaxID=215358 RepID=A0ACD3QQL7_LARCR|nr:hypothetical protein E3U43_002236 [Larimichthys crocea]
MYGLESAAAPDSGPAEERRQERFSVPRCFQPPAAGLFMHSVVNVRNAFRRQNISYNINFTFNVLSAEIVLEGSVVVFQTCTPKELLIGLLEQLEHDDPDTIAESLHLLLGPLQKVLLRLDKRKASSLGMTLSSVLDQVGQTASTSHQGARGGRRLLALSLLHRSDRLCQTLCL